MKYLKNPETNQIVKGEAFGAYFDAWQELTESEIDAYELGQAKAEKIAQIKGAAAALILTTYPTHKQLNTLMSADATLIGGMNLFISGIRAKSNELEAGLEGLSVEQIKNYPIQFTF